MTAGRHVAVIVPTFNREKKVLACVTSLLAMDYPDFEIIVIANGCVDGTGETLRRKFPDLKIMTVAEDLGAGGGRNLGVKSADADYYCFVDDDNVVDKSFLTELVTAAEADPGIGFVAPKGYFLENPDTIYSAGARTWVTATIWHILGRGQVDNGQFSEPYEIDSAPNAWLVTRDAIVATGGFDDAYGTSHEEIDWGVRATRLGYRGVFCPDAKVWHDIPWRGSQPNLRSIIGFDTPRRMFLLARNRIIFARRLDSPWGFIAFLLIFLPAATLRYLPILIWFRRFDMLGALFKGTADGLRRVLAPGGVRRIKF